MIYLFIYLMGVVEPLSMLLAFTGLVFAVASVAIALDHNTESNMKTVKPLRVWATVLLLLGALLPSKQSMELLAAVYVGEKVLQMEQVQEVGSKSFEVLDQWLDEQLEEKGE